MTKDEQKKAKVYLKKMQKALKNAPIPKPVVEKNTELSTSDLSVDNILQYEWTENMRLQTAYQQLFSRLNDAERQKAHKWLYYNRDLVGGYE